MKMSSGEFIALSACTMMLTALGIDIMLPVFGEIRDYFGLPAKSADTANIIVFFFMGQVAQILFGILSDRYGRIIILRIGFPLYIVAGIAATFAPSLPLMFLARFIAGVGASAVFMTTIAGVRDRYAGDEMARIMSLVFTIFLFTPVVAPFLGLAILSVSSWKMVFLTPPVFAIIVFFWSLRLEESLPPENRIRTGWSATFKTIRNIALNTTFARYTLITTLLFTALSVYVSSSERIVGEIYGRPELFSWIFAAIGLLMSMFALTNSRFARLYGAVRTVRILLYIYTAVAVCLLVVALAWGDPPHIVLFFGGIGLLMALNLAIEPNSSALALEPMGNSAGMASAVYGTFFFFAGSALGSLISHLILDGVMALIVSCVLFGVAGILLSKKPV